MTMAISLYKGRGRQGHGHADSCNDGGTKKNKNKNKNKKKNNSNNNNNNNNAPLGASRRKKGGLKKRDQDQMRGRKSRNPSTQNRGLQTTARRRYKMPQRPPYQLASAARETEKCGFQRNGVLHLQTLRTTLQGPQGFEPKADLARVASGWWFGLGYKFGQQPHEVPRVRVAQQSPSGDGFELFQNRQKDGFVAEPKNQPKGSPDVAGGGGSNHGL
eukprot:CAMPEP_0206461360 /NCGR_PEP_ID=MMETSP0324_2-20121206/25315_1 /ASSEMBLY_ACC=CAM_ASM_000836 /TAXON_ID=2866 /ORGANISM="Crypthecodinium cohnii, Strain Seligo" /LENGTH=215 /DNA_ID=CAMNT_0053933267 /DNA_START=46 /DNA_END=696 /DNA_ORIENTATION=-